MKNRAVKYDLILILIAIILGTFAFLIVEMSVYFLIGNSSNLERYIIGFGVLVAISCIGRWVDIRIKQKLTLGPEHGMAKINALDGATFIWWIPIVILPANFVSYWIIAHGGLEISETGLGRLAILYVSFVVLELRKYLFMKTNLKKCSGFT